MNITENIKTLIKLATENPNLPIVVMVDGEICAGDEYAYYLCGQRLEW